MKLQGTMNINSRGNLEIGGCDVADLAKRFGTPLYVLDEEHFRNNCRRYRGAFMEKHGGEVIYAAKTLLTLAICRLVEEEGLGLDVVSGGELYTAIKARFPMNRVYFHGNNKSPGEIRMALEARVGRYMVDNMQELKLLNSLAGENKTTADVIIRVTPGIEAHTHEYVKTGQIDSKFGLAIQTGQAEEAALNALGLENINLKGIHCHIGSQIFELESYVHAVGVMMDFAGSMHKKTGWIPEEINLGGGLGIYYASGDSPPTVSEYADMVIQELRKKSLEYGIPVPRLLVEPGRSISGPAGSTVYTVGTVKNIPGVRKYVAVDGGMSDNPRPALYQSRYEATLANKAGLPPAGKVSVAGKCCESGDMLIWDINLPEVEPGDILVVGCTGAYNYSMSMNYNRLPRPAMVLVGNGEADLIVKRESCEDLIRNDIIPERMRKKRMIPIASVV
ncbi:MAG: diaminopimelate decarboxylase [Bacillota bacterium]